MKRIALIVALSAAGCGPTKLAVQPDAIATTRIRPASGQHLYCPGDPFLVEVLTDMRDGSRCSSHTEGTGCMGQEGVIDPALIHLTANSGHIEGDPLDLVWVSDANPLATAATGLTLQARVGGTNGATNQGDVWLKPVYGCLLSRRFGAGPRKAAAGQPGAPGPELRIAITTLSTPFYSDAALIRVQWSNHTEYFISPSADQPVTLTSRGQDGGDGNAGAPGAPGQDGEDGSFTACQPGTPGGDGGDGQPGGPGGDGGPAGQMVLELDAAHEARLRARVVLEALPGLPGFGGRGGPGGRGGEGGEASSSLDCSLRGQAAANGQPGRPGPDGQPGQHAGPAPAPVIRTAPREKLFALEMKRIQAIEATPARKRN